MGEGVIDEEKIDDLGVSLYARCKSVLAVMDAMKNGRVDCPVCSRTVQRPSGSDAILTCDRCGWKCCWETYRGTFEGKYLNAGSGIWPFIIEFERDYRAARTYGERIVLIDTLIHRFHGELEGGNRPSPYNFIEGEPHDIVAFLDRLSYGDQIPEDVRIRRENWRNRLRTTSRFWSDQLEKDDDKRGQ